MKLFAMVLLLALGSHAAETAAPVSPSIPVTTSAPAVKSGIVGKWKTIDDETNKPKSIVEIYEDKGSYSGRIDRLFKEPNEEQNPKCDKCVGERKDKQIIGMQILSGLKKDGENTFSGGDIMDPNNGKTYSCKAELIEGGMKLKLRGFIGFSLLGRTQVWIREP